LESLEDEYKRTEEAEEGEVGEAEGSLTQRGLTAWQLFISLLLRLSYCVFATYLSILVYCSRKSTNVFYATFCID